MNFKFSIRLRPSDMEMGSCHHDHGTRVVGYARLGVMDSCSCHGLDTYLLCWCFSPDIVSLLSDKEDLRSRFVDSILLHKIREDLRFILKCSFPAVGVFDLILTLPFKHFRDFVNFKCLRDLGFKKNWSHW